MPVTVLRLLTSCHAHEISHGDEWRGRVHSFLLLYSILLNAGGIIYPFRYQWIMFKILLLQNAAINSLEFVSWYIMANISHTYIKTFMCTYIFQGIRYAHHSI